MFPEGEHHHIGHNASTQHHQIVDHVDVNHGNGLDGCGQPKHKQDIEHVAAQDIV